MRNSYSDLHSVSTSSNDDVDFMNSAQYNSRRYSNRFEIMYSNIWRMISQQINFKVFYICASIFVVGTMLLLIFKQDKKSIESSASIFTEVANFQDPVIKYQQLIERQDKNHQFLQNNMTMQLINLLRDSKYYDIHHIIQDSHMKNSIRKIHEAKPRNYKDMFKKRPTLNFTRTEKWLQKVIQKMMSPPYRPKQPEGTQTNKLKIKNLTYFYYQLHLYAQNPVYLQAQFQRLDKLYKIGKYRRQLPLCVVLTGRNSANLIQKSYQSIRRQNYTNYRVVHIDDNSYDGTLEMAIQYLKNKPQMKDRFTIIAQKYQSNLLKTKYIGIKNYCQEDQIIIQMDTQDWLIGNQVFQLINTIYQSGNTYKGKNYDVWQTYSTNIVFNQIPIIGQTGSMPELKYNNQRYSGFWRATQMRTYLWKLYNKISPDDFVDPNMPKKGEFFIQAYDKYIYYSMLQMGGPQHTVLLDQAHYYNTQSLQKRSGVQVQYCENLVKTTKQYKKLQNLDDKAIKIAQYSPQKEIYQHLQNSKSQLMDKLSILKNKTQFLLDKGSSRVKNIQKRKVVRKKFQNMTFGQMNYLAINTNRLKKNKTENFLYQKHGLQNRILIGSDYDYFNITKAVDFAALQKRLAKSVAHQILTFNEKKNYVNNKEKLKFEYFKNQKEGQKYLNNAPSVASLQIYENLAKNTPNKQMLELQFINANKFYEINQVKKQSSFCIFSSGQRTFQQGTYKHLINSIEVLNYSNFHFVYVEDYYQDENDAYKIYEWLKNSSMRIKQKITIIRNLQYLGPLANLHIWANTYCRKDDIVLVIDSGDHLLGQQALKILNSVYQNKEIWYVYSNYLQQLQNKQYQKKSTISPYQIIKFRQSNIEFSSHLVSFRKKVLEAVPLQHFLEYYYYPDTGMAYPRYFQSQNSLFYTISLMEVCGQDRIKHLREFLAFNSPKIVGQCQELLYKVQQSKYKMKYPVKNIKNLNQKSQIQSHQYSTQQEIGSLRKNSKLLKKCLKENKRGKNKSSTI